MNDEAIKDNKEEESSLTEAGVRADEVLDEQVQAEVPQVSDTPPQAEKTELKPGAQLAAKRMEAGLTMDQIASRLKLTVRQIGELEADNYDTGNGIAVTRGFIRAYAKILKADPEPLLATLVSKKKLAKPVPVAQKRESKERFSEDRSSYRSKKRNSGKVFAYLVFIMILIGAVLAGRNMGLLSFDMKKKANVSEDVQTKAVSNDVNSPKGDTAEPGPTQPPQENAAGQTTETAPGSTPASNAIPAAPGSATPQAGAGDVNKGGDNALIIHFTSPTWVQILRADSSIMYEYKGNVGEVQKLEIKEPVTFVSGDASGVAIEFRGVPVYLKSGESNSIAKVNLK